MDDSKRLSELLGIPPKYKCSKDIYNNTWEFKELVDVIDRHNLNYPDDRWCLDDFEEVFPDFQSPENFVKLQEVIHLSGASFKIDYDDCIEIAGDEVYTNDFNQSLSFTDRFGLAFTIILEGIVYDDPDFYRNFVKQAAQQNWKR